MAVIRFDAAALSAIVRSPSGPVARDLLRRGRNVESRAKVNCPVDQGRLRSSITHELVTLPGGDLAVRVGTNVKYARHVHDGTGIYGPTGAPITPKRGKVLAWKSGGAKGGTAFARSVKGSPGRPFLANALSAAAT